jgi:hypothetical protein
VSDVITQHIARLRAATVNKLGRRDVAEWIEKNTTINMRPFSFRGHEYQKRILQDESPELVIRKSAQTGISEMSMRMSLALIMIMPGAFRIGYTFPTATFAQGYSKSRLNPIIQGSRALGASINSEDLSSSEIRTFGQGKELYFKGAAVGNAAISTTLDMLVHDELSFCDQDVIGDYWSRVLHSEYKWKVSLSTPTFLGDPIDQAFTNSRRHWNFCKCQHCLHLFVPDYYKHVAVPGYGQGQDLEGINKNNIHTVDYENAHLVCPRCGKEPSLLPGHRQWVCENPSERHVAAGYQVQPFDAPTIVTVPSLVLASTKYANKTKFKQFSLGMPATDAENGLTVEDLDRMGLDMAQSPFTSHVMGVDLGMTSHFLVGGVTQDLKLGVVHMERVPLAKFRERYFALKAQFRVSITVMDLQPYTDLVMGLCAEDPNLYGASYITRQGLEVFDVRQREAEPDEAIGELRQVSVNRNAVFDKLLSEVREGNVWARKTQEWDVYKAHLQDMKRATATLRNGEFTSQWSKSVGGQDHYHHATGYLYVASQMRGVATGGQYHLSMPVSTFKHRAADPGMTVEQRVAAELEARRLAFYQRARGGGSGVRR